MLTPVLIAEGSQSPSKQEPDFQNLAFHKSCLPEIGIWVLLSGQKKTIIPKKGTMVSDASHTDSVLCRTVQQAVL